jgi:type II secretory pathway pseudopilin PulG
VVRLRQTGGFAVLEVLVGIAVLTVSTALMLPLLAEARVSERKAEAELLLFDSYVALRDAAREGTESTSGPWERAGRRLVYGRCGVALEEPDTLVVDMAWSSPRDDEWVLWLPVPEGLLKFVAMKGERPAVAVDVCY